MRHATVRDLSDMRQKIAEHALTILVNLTGEQDVVELLAANDKFVDSLLAKIVVSLYQPRPPLATPPDNPETR
jgi:hypothetical protein